MSRNWESQLSSAVFVRSAVMLSPRKISQARPKKIFVFVEQESLYCCALIQHGVYMKRVSRVRWFVHVNRGTNKLPVYFIFIFFPSSSSSSSPFLWLWVRTLRVRFSPMALQGVPAFFWLREHARAGLLVTSAWPKCSDRAVPCSLVCLCVCCVAFFSFLSPWPVHVSVSVPILLSLFVYGDVAYVSWLPMCPPAVQVT